MKEQTILHIASKLHPLCGRISVRQIPWQESGGYYNVWEIRDETGCYLLKKSNSDTELAVYQMCSGSCHAFPHLYGSVTYRQKPFILLEYVDGHDLTRANRNDLIAVLDAMIRMQDTFWNTEDTIGSSFSESFDRCLTRRSYLSEDTFINAFAVFSERYHAAPRTLCHGDFLPFNLIIGSERVVFIDWEYGGILPYPVMLARLLAHTSTNGETPFYMSPEDVEFAIAYYYENLIRKKGIPYSEYRKTMRAFLFYEQIEWIYVYRKYGKKPDQRFDYAYRTAAISAVMLLDDN